MIGLVKQQRKLENYGKLKKNDWKTVKTIGKLKTEEKSYNFIIKNRVLLRIKRLQQFEQED